jgi:hypothetical protein
VAVTFPCGSCGTPRPTEMPRHWIGVAFIDGVAHDKWCDGTETTRP